MLIHARASTRLAQLANQFSCAIKVSRLGEDEEVDAKSILGILTLGVAKGQMLRIRVNGDDADKAMDAVVDLVQGNFGEE